MDKDLWELLEQYKERFHEPFGTLGWIGIPTKHQKVIELIQRAFERGSPTTDEEYYIELCGFSAEEYKKLREGKIFI